MKHKEIEDYIHRLEDCVPKIMRGLRMMRKGYATDGLSLSQELVLISLLQHGESNMSSLSETTGINVTALTAIIDGLVKRDLVFRKRDSEIDRRAVFVKLSAAGYKQAKKLHKNRAIGIKHAIQVLSKDERETIISGFEKMVNSKIIIG
jgi:DNA-binding MarR family transcriptional regulator